MGYQLLEDFDWGDGQQKTKRQSAISVDSPTNDGGYELLQGFDWGKQETPTNEPGIITRAGRAVGKLIDAPLTKAGEALNIGQPDQAEIDQAGLQLRRQKNEEDKARIEYYKQRWGTEDANPVMRGFMDIISGVSNAYGPGMEEIGRLSGWKWLEGLGHEQQIKAAAMQRSDTNVVDDWLGGFGSVLGFAAAGQGVATSVLKGAQWLLNAGKLAPATATALAKSGSSIAAATGMSLESAGIAQQAYDQGMDLHGNEKLAETRGILAGVISAPIVFFTDKFGIFGDTTKALRAVLNTMAAEGAQEGTQQLLTNVASYRPAGEGVSYNALLGALSGGGVTGIQVAVEKYAQRNADPNAGGVDVTLDYSRPVPVEDVIKAAEQNINVRTAVELKMANMNAGDRQMFIEKLGQNGHGELVAQMDREAMIPEFLQNGAAIEKELGLAYRRIDDAIERYLQPGSTQDLASQAEPQAAPAVQTGTVDKAADQLLAAKGISPDVEQPQMPASVEKRVSPAANQEELLNALYEELDKTTGQAIARDSIKVAKPTAELSMLQAAIKNAFDTDILYVDSSGIRFVQGGQLQKRAFLGKSLKDRNAIVVNLSRGDSKTTIKNTIGHELTHQLETRFPGIFKGLQAAALAHISTGKSQLFKGWLSTELQAEHAAMQKELSPEDFRAQLEAEYGSEIPAEVVGEMWDDAGYWSAVFQNGPQGTFAQKVVSTVKGLLNRLQRALISSGYVRGVRDVNAMRTAVDKAFKQWEQAQAAQKFDKEQKEGVAKERQAFAEKLGQELAKPTAPQRAAEAYKKVAERTFPATKTTKQVVEEKTGVKRPRPIKPVGAGFQREQLIEKIVNGYTPTERDLRKHPSVGKIYNKLQEFRQKVEESKSAFDKKVIEVAALAGGDSVIPDVKPVSSAFHKIVTDYKGDVGRIKDMLRATINLPDTHMTFPEVKALIDSRFTGVILKRNGWAPDAKPSAEGYRDILFNVRVGGIMGEILINTPAMTKAKAEEGHKLYEVTRAVERKQKIGHVPTLAEKLKVAKATIDQRKIYAKATEESLKRFRQPIPLRFQRDQTQTPEFKRWFGDSKVVDENGRPLVVYHGSNADFNEFKYGEEGFHFGTKEQAATMGAKVRPFFLSAQKLFRLSDDLQNWNDIEAVADYLIRKRLLGKDEAREFPGLQEWLESKGYDGYSYPNSYEGGGDSYAVFRPEQIKSAIGNRGTFSASDARLNFQRAVTEEGHTVVGTTGKLVGSPGWVVGAKQLTKLRSDLKKLQQQGAEARYWYENSSKTILDMFNGDKAQAEKFVGLLAIYSQDASVKANTTMALNAYYQWLTGQPIHAHYGDQDRKAKEWLDKGVDWGGIKTNNFYVNLMTEIDPTKVDKHATMDLWMKRAFGYDSKGGQFGPQQYGFMLRETQRLARELGWTPHQVQAAIWTGIKAKTEETTPDTAGASFTEALNERMAQLSWEAQPGETVNVLPGLQTAPINQKFEYFNDILRILYSKDGTDLIAQKLGLPHGVQLSGFSAWKGNIGAGGQMFVPVRLEGQGNKRRVGDNSRAMLNAYSALKGYILSQEAVVWHYPIYDAAIKNSNGYEATFNRALNADEMKQLYSAIHDRFGTWDLAPGYTPNGVRILNFTDIDNKQFHSGMTDIINALPDNFGDGVVDHVVYRSDGEYISNDWQAHPDGSEYLQKIGPAQGGRTQPSDLQAWADGLRASVEAVNRTYSDKYGWGEWRQPQSRAIGQAGEAVEASQAAGVAQPAWLAQRAAENGFASVDEWLRQQPDQFMAAAEQWRSEHPTGFQREYAPRQEGEDLKAYMKRAIDTGPIVESLPQDPKAYFEIGPGTELLPISKLDLSKPAENEKGGINAPKRFLASAAGVIPKREPIHVERRGDRYLVIDGNGTVAALRRFGWNAVPATVIESSGFQRVQAIPVSQRQYEDIPYLTKRAMAAGYTHVDEWRTAQPEAFARAVREAAETPPQLPMFQRQLPEAVQQRLAGTKIVDEQGNPLLVYHGTRHEEPITQFKRSSIYNRVDGIYFAADPEQAAEYTKDWGSPRQLAGTIYPAYLAIKNPAGRTELDAIGYKFSGAEMRAELEKRGFDGVNDPLMREIIAFHPEQIISPFNNGTQGFQRQEPASVQMTVASIPELTFAIETLQDTEGLGVTDLKIGKGGVLTGPADQLQELSVKLKSDYGDLGIESTAATRKSMLAAAARIDRAVGVKQYEAPNLTPEQRQQQTDEIRADLKRGYMDMGMSEADAEAQAQDDMSSRFQRQPPTEGERFTIPGETRAQQAQRLLQNQLNRLDVVQKAVQEAGGTITEPTDMSLAAELYPRIVANAVNRFKQFKVERLMRRIGQQNVNLNDIELYMYATHALEANKYIASINPMMPDGGSGMLDEQAEQALESIRKDPDFAKIKAFADELWDITEQTRKVQLASGLITPTIYAGWKGRYQHYVPLKGFANVDEAGRVTNAGIGARGFDVRGQEARRRYGRTTLAGNIVANIISDHERALVRAERNRVAKVIGNFVLANPDSKLWEVNKIKATPQFYKSGQLDENGLAEGEVRYLHSINMDPESTIVYKHYGQAYAIWIKDNGMLQALKGPGGMMSQSSEDVSKLMQRWMGVNRFLAKMWTGWNPVFITTNFARDFLTGMIHATNIGGVRYAAGTMGDILKAGKGIWDVELRNNNDSEWAKLYEQYKADGGKTGFYMWSDLESRQNEIQKLIDHANNATTSREIFNRGRDAIRRIEETVMDVNGMIENAIRLSAYKNAIENLGMSRAQAAQLAGNLTVNFNRKGELTPKLSSLFLFFNPSVQGPARIVQAAKNNPKSFAAALGGLVSLGLLLGMLGADDKDEEGVPYWDRIPGYEKNRSLVIMTGGGNRVTIPMPYGYGFFVTLGYAIADLVRDRPKSAVGLDLLKSLGQHYNPLGASDNLVTMVSPTVIDPFVEWGMNEKATGLPLMPDEQTITGMPVPQSERYWSTTRGTPLQKFFSWLNEATGGTKVQPGALSFSPEVAKNFINYYLGGAGNFVMDGVQSAALMSDLGIDAALQSNKVPFLRQWYKFDNTQDDTRFYQESKQKALASLEEAKKYYNTDRPAVIDRMTRERGLAALGASVSAVDRAMRSLRLREIAIVEDETLTPKEKYDARRELDREREDLLQQWNAKFYEAELESRR